MDPIYVTGHRNPDTDSIVAAIAYAALRNALGDWDYVPARLGHVSDETMRILDRFGYEPPMRLFDVYTQVRDLDYEKSQTLFRTVTGKVRLKLYKGNMINAGVWSTYSLYDPEIATFDEDEVYNQADAAGFITLFGLPIKVQAVVNEKNKNN